MIDFRHVTVTYDGASAPVLDDLTFQVPEGELCLVIGSSGSGKSTLLRCVNGLVPHFTGGTLTGEVSVAGRSTSGHHPRDLADVVGYVGQDPVAGFVTDAVEDELAYAMESLSVPAPVMRKRVEENLDLLGIANVRERPLATLSGGQQQRVAIAGALTANPRVLVLDEPTSALDPQGGEEVLTALRRLVHDLGITILLAEHRLERVVQFADRALLLPDTGGPALVGSPQHVLARSSLAPPVVELGRLAGWAPLPLSVRDARRRAPELLPRLASDADSRARQNGGRSSTTVLGASVDLVAGYRNLTALHGVSCELRAGQVTAVMGRNGSGKSTLLKAFVGLLAPTSGSVTVGGRVPTSLRPSAMFRLAGLVPAEPTDILYAESVQHECRLADADAHARPGTCESLVSRLTPDVSLDRHPRDLSEGQRLALALCVILTAAPPLVLLDEPTRGLDYGAKQRLVDILRLLAAEGHGVVLATHDVELVAEVADRVLVLAEGRVVADDTTTAVVTSSPVLAPQVAKVLPGGRWLTVADVAESLAVGTGGPGGLPVGAVDPVGSP